MDDSSSQETETKTNESNSPVETEEASNKNHITTGGELIAFERELDDWSGFSNLKSFASNEKNESDFNFETKMVAKYENNDDKNSKTNSIDFNTSIEDNKFGGFSFNKNNVTTEEQPIIESIHWYPYGLKIYLKNYNEKYEYWCKMSIKSFGFDINLHKQMKLIHIKNDNTHTNNNNNNKNNKNGNNGDNNNGSNVCSKNGSNVGEYRNDRNENSDGNVETEVKFSWDIGNIDFSKEEEQQEEKHGSCLLLKHNEVIFIVKNICNCCSRNDKVNLYNWGFQIDTKLVIKSVNLKTLQHSEWSDEYCDIFKNSNLNKDKSNERDISRSLENDQILFEKVDQCHSEMLTYKTMLKNNFDENKINKSNAENKNKGNKNESNENKNNESDSNENNNDNENVNNDENINEENKENSNENGNENDNNGDNGNADENNNGSANSDNMNEENKNNSNEHKDNADNNNNDDNSKSHNSDNSDNIGKSGNDSNSSKHEPLSMKRLLEIESTLAKIRTIAQGYKHECAANKKKNELIIEYSKQLDTVNKLIDILHKQQWELQENQNSIQSRIFEINKHYNDKTRRCSEIQCEVNSIKTNLIPSTWDEFEKHWESWSHEEMADWFQYISNKAYGNIKANFINIEINFTDIARQLKERQLRGNYLLLCNEQELDKLGVSNVEFQKVLMSEIKILATKYPTKNSVISKEKSIRCCICLTNDINILLLPCGHACMCKECASKCCNGRRMCPMCRKWIKSTVGIFIA